MWLRPQHGCAEKGRSQEAPRRPSQPSSVLAGMGGGSEPPLGFGSPSRMPAVLRLPQFRSTPVEFGVLVINICSDAENNVKM